MNFVLQNGRPTYSVTFILIALVVALHTDFASAQIHYKVQPGDVLAVSVWKESDLTMDITVHPDGTFTVPLIGEIRASNHSIPEIQEDIAKRLSRYIPDPVVTIGLKESVGSQIYVIGQVNAPGTFTVHRLPDVVQALSMAGGMTAYASENKIRILRRESDTQRAIGFRYGDVVKGKKLEQNIVLQDGDVVVVP